MSRSNPTTEKQVNPAQRWFEWQAGATGGFVSYYDKATKQNVPVKLPFSFLLLETLATCKGWHEPSESAIFANEVRDSKSERLVVRSFKGGELAAGFYAEIRDRIVAVGGHFVSSLYIAFKGDAGNLQLGNLQLKGAALNAWVEFKKSVPTDTVGGRKISQLYTKAVSINAFGEGKKGSIVFRFPKFKLVDVTPETNTAGNQVDAILQAYLSDYFRKPKAEQSEQSGLVDDADRENQAADAIAEAQARAELPGGDVPL